MADEKYMTFITGVHFTKSMLRTLNGITFLFDPNWEAGVNDVATFPVTFFHLRAIHEVLEADVSKKQMLFYNSQRSVTNDTTTGSLLNVVADNVVIKPKMYKLDVIIPYSDLTLLTGNYTLQPEQFAGVSSFLMHGKATEYNFAPYFTMATPYVSIIKSILKQLMLADSSSVGNFFSSVISTPDYNKNSLEAMFRNRSILKLKLWNGWKYKYVVITNIDISKESDEDGVYEASITCQELPILTIRNNAGLTYKPYVNPILTASGNIVKDILNGKEEK